MENNDRLELELVCEISARKYPAEYSFFLQEENQAYLDAAISSSNLEAACRAYKMYPEAFESFFLQDLESGRLDQLELAVSSGNLATACRAKEDYPIQWQELFEERKDYLKDFALWSGNLAMACTAMNKYPKEFEALARQYKEDPSTIGFERKHLNRVCEKSSSFGQKVWAVLSLKL